MKMTLQKKVIGGLSIVVLFMMMIAIGSRYMIGNINKTLEDIDRRAMPQALLTGKLATNMALQVLFTRDYVVSGEESYIQQYKSVSDISSKWEDELEKNTATERGKQFAQEVKKLDDSYDKIVLEKIVPLKQSGKNEEAIMVMRNEGDAVGKALIGKINEYVDFREEMMSSRMKQARQEGNETQWIIEIISVLSLLVGIGIGIFINRFAIKPIQMATVDLEKMAQRDYTFVISPKNLAREDEIGQLARAMQTVSGNMKEIIRHLVDSSGQLGASSEELTASTEQSAQAVNQVAQTITDVAAGAWLQLKSVDATINSVEERSVGIEKMANNAEDVVSITKKTSSSAIQGEKTVEQAIAQMQNIERTVGDSAKVVAKLGENSKEIGQIVDTISGIAGQTNLLALNAAIEAARAGEQGRGFSVVAEEVRKLAEQSQEASKHIANLIAEIQGDTENAVLAMSKGTREVQLGAESVNLAGKTFSEIASLVEQVSEQVANIALDIQETASGSQQIISSVKDIDKISRDTVEQTQGVSAAIEEQSASMQEIASASQSLTVMAEKLHSIINQFKI